MIKKLYICILTFLKSIVACYDNSIIASTIERVWQFFSSKSNQSLSINHFRNNFSSTKYFLESITAKIISLPFSILRAFYNKNKCTIEDIKSKSSVLSFLKNFIYVPIRQYGIITLSFSAASLISSFATGKFNIIVSLLVALLGFIMLTTPATINNTLSSSRLALFIARLLLINPMKESDKIYSIKSTRLILTFAILLGVIAGLTNPLFMLVSFACASVCILIMYKTIIGVYIFVALCAFLPTMALVGIIVITFISYALHLLLSTDGSYRITPFTILIAAFALVALFASVTGVNPKSSIAVLMVYMAFFLSFTIMANTVKTKKQWCSLVAVFAISAFFVAAYGVLQNFFITVTDQTWVDPDMFEDIKKRVYSTLDNPNVLGQFLILSIPLTVACMMYAKSKAVKLTYFVFVLTGAACLVFTWSRAAWVGVILAIVIMLLKKDKRFLAVLIAGLILMPMLLPDTILNRLTSIGNTSDTSTSYRIAVWTASINMIKDNYLTGIGLGSDAFGQMYQNYAISGASFALHAHNFYLQWIADMGIGGLFIYIMIMLTAYKGIYKIRSASPLARLAGYAIAGSLAGYLFQGMAETMWYTYRMILIFWIFIAFIQTADVSEGEFKND